MNKIILNFKNFKLNVLLNNTNIAQEIFNRIPFKSCVNVWGEEIYFPIPIILKNEIPTTEVEIGDIGYWPQGNSFCIFFGKTPISKSSKPMPYSEITLIGKFDTKKEIITMLKNVNPKENVELTK